MPIKLRCASHRLEKAFCLTLWILILLCLLGESLYLMYTGYLDPRASHISNFDAVVRDWNATGRSEFSGLKVTAGEKHWEELQETVSDLRLSEKGDEEVKWYIPLHYTGVLNQSDFFQPDFDYDVNVTISVKLQSSTTSWEFFTPSLPTIRTVKEQVTELTCSHHSGYHDPIFGWCISFLKLTGICTVVTKELDQWQLSAEREGCAGEEMTELAEYEHIPIQPGAQTPALPIPASSIAVIVRSVSDPIFTAYTETGGSFDFGVKDTVYKVLGVSLLGVSLIMLIHPMCYFRRKYRDWRRAQHRKFVDPGEDARRSKTPPMEDVSF